MKKIILSLLISFLLISCWKNEEASVLQESRINIPLTPLAQTWSVSVNTWFVQTVETSIPRWKSESSWVSVPPTSSGTIQIWETSEIQMSSIEKSETNSVNWGSEENWTDNDIEKLSLIDFTNSKIDSKSLTEYKQMLLELSDMTGSGRRYLNDRSFWDAKILNTYSGLLLKLFNKWLLPTLKTFKIGNKEYIVTVWFFPWSDLRPFKKEEYRNWKGSCGNVSVPWWSYDGICVLIRKENDKIIIDSDFWLKNWSWEPAFEVIQWKYLLSNRSDWDSCSAFSSYSLFDSDLKNISWMHIRYNWCEWMETTFRKWDSAIRFYQPFQSDEQTWKNNKKEKWFEGWDFSSLTFLKTPLIPWEVFWWQYRNSKYFLYTSDSQFKLDVVKNLLNWNKFSFTINDKDVNFDPANESTWYTTDEYDIALSMKKISEWYEVSGSNQKGIDSISIKSCKDNGNEYDNDLFSPKSLDKENGTFTYKISKKFWNLCRIPYEFTFKLKGDEKPYSKKVELVFP